MKQKLKTFYKKYEGEIKRIVYYGGAGALVAVVYARKVYNTEHVTSADYVTDDDGVDFIVLYNVYDQARKFKKPDQ